MTAPTNVGNFRLIDGFVLFDGYVLLLDSKEKTIYTADHDFKLKSHESFSFSFKKFAKEGCGYYHFKNEFAYSGEDHQLFYNNIVTDKNQDMIL